MSHKMEAMLIWFKEMKPLYVVLNVFFSVNFSE